MAKTDTHSIAILSHLRWLAAFFVAYSHIRQNLLVDYSAIPHPGILDKILFFMANYGHAGVIVFFVLSGFLVGGKAISLSRSQDIATEWPHFLADRISRIFVVLLPALLVCAGILLFLHFEAPTAPFMTSAPWGWAINRPVNSDFSALRWLNAIVLLNELTSRSLMIDSPLWSLAFEWFYYMAILAVVLARRRIFSAGALVVIAYAAGLTVLAIIFNPYILYLGLVWLLGVVAKMVFDWRMLEQRSLQWLGIAVLAGLLITGRVIHYNDLLLGASVAFVIAHRRWGGWRGGERWGAGLAAFSFSFYVLHFPLSILVLGILFRFGDIRQRLPLDAQGLAVAAGTLAGAIVFARIFAFFTEDRTRQVRNLIWRRAPRRQHSLQPNAPV